MSPTCESITSIAVSWGSADNTNCITLTNFYCVCNANLIKVGLKLYQMTCMFTKVFLCHLELNKSSGVKEYRCTQLILFNISLK